MAPHSSTLAWENPMDGGAWWAAVHGIAKSGTRLSDFTFTFHFHGLEKEMAPHSSILAWRIPGSGKPGGLRSMGLHRVGHDWSDLAAAAAAALDNGGQSPCLDISWFVTVISPTKSLLLWFNITTQFVTSSVGNAGFFLNRFKVIDVISVYCPLV